MKRSPVLSALTLTACLAGALTTTARAADIPADPKTLAAAIDRAKGGDSILLATGEYAAVTISQTYDQPLTIAAAPNAKPVFTGGLALRNGGGVHVTGLTFTWPPGNKPAKPMTPFLEITGCKNIEVANCEIYDDPKANAWVGNAASIGNSDRITIRDTKAHHFYFGFSAYQSKNVLFKNLTIGPWTHEDGIRFTQCEGPVTAEGCVISNTGVPGAKGGHVDAIQVVYWTENLTVRNCILHGMGQGIGAFGEGRDGRRSKNWRIEGNLIYDVYAPHACSTYNVDGVTIINNTFPMNRPFAPGSTNVVIKNNILGQGTNSAKDFGDSDYNFYITGNKIGEHDLSGDPKFVNVPLLMLRNNYRAEGNTRSKLVFQGSLAGRLAVGDAIQLLPTDGSARDTTVRKVTAVDNNSIEFDPPLAGDPEFGVFVYKWPKDAKNITPDYRLQPGSPALDSADSAVKRTPDMDGHTATDIPAVPNTGAGEIKHLDRGAFEYVPAK